MTFRILTMLRARRRLGSPEKVKAGSRHRLRVEQLEERMVLSPPGTGWQMLFADEFNGTSLNTAVWNAASGARRNAVNTPSAVTVGGGNLTITTYTQNNTHYTGFIGSHNGMRATYGYWEARVKFQSTSGMWSAFWLQSPTMGNPIGNPGTAGTEIDIVEHRARDQAGADLRNRAAINLHWDGYGQYHRSTGTTVNNPNGTPSLQGNFHLYGLQWSPSGYQFHIDDRLVWSTTQAVSRRSEFIYLTSEVQNNSWAGPIPGGGYGSQAASTTKMIVDHVRVWQRPVSNVPNLDANEGVATAAIPVTVTQRDNTTTTYTATSSVTGLLPNANLVRGGSGANRTLTATPLAGQTGTTTVTVNAASGPVSGSDTFTLTVHAGRFTNGGFEADPSGTAWGRYGGAQITTSGQRSGGRATRIVGYGGSEQVVTNLQPNTTYTLGGYARVTAAGVAARIGVKNYGGADRSTTLSGTSYARGTVSFTTGPTSTEARVYVFKPTAEAEGFFDDLYLFRAPMVTGIYDQETEEDTPAPALPFSVSGVTGAYTITATSSDTALVPNGNLTLAGSGRDWSLTATPAPDRHGTATITVRVADPHGGSTQRSFRLTVHPVNDAPVQTAIPDQEIVATQNIVIIPLEAADVDGDPVTFTAVAHSLAYVLDQELGLEFAGDYYENQWGLGEKWLQSASGFWYCILPSGELYREDWEYQGNVGASYWAAPTLLHDAIPDQPHAAVTIVGNELVVDLDDGFVGSLVLWVTASDGLLFDTRRFTLTVWA